MKIPDDAIERIEKAVMAEAQLHTDLVREFLADLQVQYPIGVGLLGGLAGTLVGLVVTQVNLQLTIPLLVMSVVALSTVIVRQHGKNKLLQRAYVSTAEAYFAFTAERDSHARSKAAQERQFQWLLAVSVMLEIAHRYVKHARDNPDQATPTAAATACDRILEKLEEVRHGCLKYEPDDPKYNLHLFRWDEASERLVGFARRHGQQVPENNRQWRAGGGHAGVCYESGEMMCLDDLQGPEGQGYRREVKPMDNSLYRAIVDAPIRCGDSIWGILAITSGTPGQFAKGDFAPLALVTGVIGMIVAVTNW